MTINNTAITVCKNEANKVNNELLKSFIHNEPVNSLVNKALKIIEDAGMYAKKLTGDKYIDTAFNNIGDWYYFLSEISEEIKDLTIEEPKNEKKVCDFLQKVEQAYNEIWDEMEERVQQSCRTWDEEINREWRIDEEGNMYRMPKGIKGEEADALFKLIKQAREVTDEIDKLKEENIYMGELCEVLEEEIEDIIQELDTKPKSCDLIDIEGKIELAKCVVDDLAVASDTEINTLWDWMQYTGKSINITQCGFCHDNIDHADIKNIIGRFEEDYGYQRGTLKEYIEALSHLFGKDCSDIEHNCIITELDNGIIIDD